ncbi:MAG: isocitrate/isopropylmalate family dehydrogenase [Candidatus Sericytochromatia bacterium]
MNPLQSTRLSEAIPEYTPAAESATLHVLGVLPGEGVGPEVIGTALEVLEVVGRHSSRRFEIRTGGMIGMAARREHGMDLTEQVNGFCEEIFHQGGAVICGPGGGRFVYELRARFDLYCKFAPLVPLAALQDTGPLRPASVQGVDIIVVRENISGLYFGEWGTTSGVEGNETAFHQLTYQQDDVDRILAVGHRLAQMRRGRLCVAVKPHGIPSISQLWEERAKELNRNQEVELSLLEIDNASYQLIARAQDFDVVVAPNMFGDVLADCGALLLGSRGMSFSGNFGAGGKAVYQTGHGAAYDLAGSDKANPLGQILSLAMMLRESYAWPEGAARIEAAVARTLEQGYRTPDIAAEGCQVVGTRELARQVCQAIEAGFDS